MTINHHTPAQTLTQEQLAHEDGWEQAVLQKLPEGWEEQARQQKALQRKRGVACASALLRGVLAYVLGVMSVREWSAWAVLVGLANISEAAWRKRLRHSSAWLLWIFSQLLSTAPAVSARRSDSARVLLIDATRLRQPGGSGDDWRLHLAYDLWAGRFAEVKLTDWHGAEQLDYYHLRPGDILVADAGYGIRRNIALVLQQRADAILRIHPSTFPVLDAQGQNVNLFSMLRSAPTDQLELDAFFLDEAGQCYPIRILAQALPPEKAEWVRMRKRKVAQKHGRAIRADTLLAAGWVILVTTLVTRQWLANDVLRLYRARWQIELVFKRMKQILRLNQLRSTHPDSVEACIRALLVAWALQEQEANQAKSTLERLTHASNRCSSSWLLTKFSLTTLRLQVLGSWSLAHFEACLPLLARFLTAKQQKRIHQETSIRKWLDTLVGFVFTGAVYGFGY